MRMSVRLRIVLALGVALAAARARPDEIIQGVPSARTLNGHVFQVPSLLLGPFTPWQFGVNTLVGSGTTIAPTYNILGRSIGGQRYTIGSYGEEIGASFRLTPDIALRLDITGTLFSGTSGRGLLFVGGSTQFGLTGGLTAGKNIGHSMRLSFVADFGIQPQYSVLIGNAVLHAVQTGVLSSSGLFSNVERLYGSPGLSYAWAPWPAFGLIAEARYIWTHRYSSNTVGTAQGVSLGVGLGLDLEPLIHWPIGFQASYRGDIPAFDTGIAEVHQAGGGIYYTRRVRLQLGLEVNWRRGEIRPPTVLPSLVVNSTTGSIVLHYYW